MPARVTNIGLNVVIAPAVAIYYCRRGASSGGTREIEGQATRYQVCLVG